MKTLDIQTLSLYLGCQVITNSGIKGRLVTTDMRNDLVIAEISNAAYQTTRKPIRHVKPILRPLSSMTEEEARELFPTGTDTIAEYKKTPIGWAITYSIDAGEEGTYVNTHDLQWNELSPRQFSLLLSRGFDLFNLIPEGLAVEKK